MTVQAITNLSAYDSILSTTARSSNTQTQSVTSLDSDEVSLNNSSMAKGMAFFQKMEELQSTDPAKFKEIMSDLASKLKAAAEEATDPKQKEFLTKMSEDFATSAETGKMPEKPAHGHGHGGAPPPPPPSGYDASGTAQTDQTSQKQTFDLLASLFDQALKDAGSITTTG